MLDTVTICAAAARPEGGALGPAQPRRLGRGRARRDPAPPRRRARRALGALPGWRAARLRRLLRLCRAPAPARLGRARAAPRARALAPDAARHHVRARRRPRAATARAERQLRIAFANVGVDGPARRSASGWRRSPRSPLDATGPDRRPQRRAALGQVEHRRRDSGELRRVLDQSRRRRLDADVARALPPGARPPPRRRAPRSRAAGRRPLRRPLRVQPPRTAASASTSSSTPATTTRIPARSVSSPTAPAASPASPSSSSASTARST